MNKVGSKWCIPEGKKDFRGKIKTKNLSARKSENIDHPTKALRKTGNLG